MIRAAAQGTEIVYTVPEGVEGTYDMYLTVSKVLAAFSSQPFTFTINDGDTFSVPVDLQVPADSPGHPTKRMETTTKAALQIPEDSLLSRAWN